MKSITRILSLCGIAAASLLLANCACVKKAGCASCSSCATDEVAAKKACPTCGKAACTCAPAKTKAKKS